MCGRRHSSLQSPSEELERRVTLLFEARVSTSSVPFHDYSTAIMPGT